MITNDTIHSINLMLGNMGTIIRVRRSGNIAAKLTLVEDEYIIIPPQVYPVPEFYEALEAHLQERGISIEWDESQVEFWERKENSMKALTVIQPWATLIALGEKHFETRSWARKHRGELAIHAGKKVDREACIREPIRSVLAKHGYTAANLPTGVVVAIGNLTGCHSIGKVDDFQKEAELPWVDRFIWGNEFDFGWYERGRFAWELKDIQQLPEPIAAKGQQGLWNWKVKAYGT